MLSGSRRFTGAIAGSFVVPATVDRLSLDVGFIDTPGSVAVTVFGPDVGTLGSVPALNPGIDTLASRTHPRTGRQSVPATSRRYGLVARSRAIVVSGP